MNKSNWFFTYSYRSRGKDDLLIANDVFQGTFAQLVVLVCGYNSEDDIYYTDYRLISWKKLSALCYRHIEDVVQECSS